MIAFENVIAFGSQCCSVALDGAVSNYFINTLKFVLRFVVLQYGDFRLHTYNFFAQEDNVQHIEHRGGLETLVGCMVQ